MDGGMEIRQITAEERLGTMFALQAYAFSPSPWTPAEAERYRDQQRFDRETVGLVAEEGGEALACAAAIRPAKPPPPCRCSRRHPRDRPAARRRPGR